MITLQDTAHLTTLYNSPDRHYHNMRHINRCLGVVETLDIDRAAKNVLNTAIWFHDAVYNPYSKENEENSIQLFETSSTISDMQEHEFRFVIISINSTRLHTEDQEFLIADGGSYAKFMLDIDLIGLADDPPQYRTSAINIRKEYYNVDFETFIVSRRKFVTAMLNRKFIYYTDDFKHLHTQAYRNLNNELSILQDTKIYNRIKNYYGED